MRFFSEVNPIIRIMVLANLFIVGAEGFLAPIFAVFVTKTIEHASVATVGYSLTVFWLVKSLVQLPLSRAIDNYDGERDDFLVVFFGLIIYGLVLLGYIFARDVWHIYALQALAGLAAACVFPGYSAMFTRHGDAHREGFEWSLNSLAVGIGVSSAAAGAGYIADHFGFAPIFLLASLFTITGALLFLLIRKEIFSHVIKHDAKYQSPIHVKRRH